MNRWLAFVNSDVHPSFKPFFGAADYLGDPGLVEKAQDEARKKLRTLFERADQQLAGKAYIAGERSIADPYLFVMLRWARGVKLDLSGLPHLQSYFDRMREDPGVQRVLDAEAN